MVFLASIAPNPSGINTSDAKPPMTVAVEALRRSPVGNSFAAVA
jgi:hypothetical protein